MPAHAAFVVIGVDHHGHGVPAHQALDAPLDLAIARIRRLLFGRDGVEVRGADRLRHLDACRPQARDQAGHNQAGLLRPLIFQRHLQHGFERLQQFLLGGAWPGKAVVRRPVSPGRMKICSDF